VRGGQGAERAYRLWEARQVVEEVASLNAPVVTGVKHKRAGKRLLRRRRGRGLPGVSVGAVGEGEGEITRAALLDRAIHSLKPGVFEELMEMMGCR
jgi:hypothetical protein